MTTTASVQTLYTVRAGQVQTVDVPELGFVLVEGTGAPESAAFAEALQALYGVSYAAHFLERQRQVATKVMPLEALWWADDPEHRSSLSGVQGHQRVYVPSRASPSARARSRRMRWASAAFSAAPRHARRTLFCSARP